MDLEVDHIDPETKELNPAAIWSRREEVRNKELAKCQVLCSTCHKAKSAAYKASKVVHGSYAMRNYYNCECAECKEFIRDSKREWRQKRVLVSG